MKEIRFDIKIENQKEFKDFVDWADFVGLKWACKRKIELNDWDSVKDRICVFWFSNNKFLDFETCASVTYNCKAIVHYISQTFEDFIKPWKM